MRRRAVPAPVVEQHPALAVEQLRDLVEGPAAVEHAVDENDEGLAASDLRDLQIHPILQEFSR